MSGIDDETLALIVSISDDVAQLRKDVKAIQTGLTRIGAIIPKKPESVKLATTWNPPVLKRLGDIVTIIAQSNPATAEAFKQAIGDTAKDPAADPEVDPNADADVADGTDVTDGTDPKLKDADRNVRNMTKNPRNFLPSFLGGDDDPNFKDTDPNKKDRTVNKRNVANIADPMPPPDTRDDPDGVTQVKPDTPTDPRVEG